jgi:hypothetical protein
MRRSVPLVIVTALALRAATAVAADAGFEPPLAEQTVTLRPATKIAPATILTCRSFARFMVKVVDAGEVGAERLAIAPIRAGAAKPACRRAAAPGEVAVDPKAWAGYFKGVKGDYVLFDAADGIDGALGFVVVGAGTARVLFEGLAVGDLGVTEARGTLTLRYRRSVRGACSVVKDGAPCWQRIAREVGLDPARAPDCAAGYDAGKRELAAGRCEAASKLQAACIEAALKEIAAQRFDETPSVIEHDVETVVTTARATTTLRGPALACRPAD